MDKPHILQIKKIVQESKRVKSFVFDFDMPGMPGQFVMTWIPGYDELPFGIINKENEGFMISVAAVGEATEAMHRLKEGDLLGIRGPYGTYFNLPGEGSTIAVIAGGYGIVPLSFLAQEARKKNIDVHVFNGARSKDELNFVHWMEEIGAVNHISTDDGSAGFHGYNTDLFAQQLRDIKPDKVFTVGPEIMEAKIADLCWKHDIPFEVSLERYMKCGFGVCGQCCIDPIGWRMCVEGPVLDGEKLKQVKEFNKYYRDATGKKVQFSWLK